jgi:HSP20 family molecular chaperone IbpA
MPHTVTAWRWSCDVAKQKDPKNKGKIVGARELRGIQDDGRFERSLTLPKGVDSDQLKASYQHGVLELTMAASPQLAGRKIPIEIGM